MGREKALTYFLLYNLLSLPLPVQIQELYLHVLYCHTCHSEQILYYHCKESPCNARDSSFIPGSGRSHGTKGTFHAKMGTIKDRNSMDLTEAKGIKKRWQEYTEELYKKYLHDPDNHYGVITHLEPDILECEVKWA